MGSFEDYSKQKEHAASKAKIAEVFGNQNQINSGSSLGQVMAPGPNTNAQAPKGKDAKMSNK